MKSHIVILPAFLGACSDYDLYRPDKEPLPPQIETDTDRPQPGPDPDIHVEPATLSFGGWPADCPADPITVTITNEGQGDLVVSDILLEGQGSSAFAHNGAPPTLAYGEEYAFQVDFVPGGTFDYTIDLRVDSNDPDEATVFVPADGAGGEDSIFEESFYQDYEEIVDILWVVDNSCSMGEETSMVASNFESFINEFVDLGLDYHMGVITTDMIQTDHSGKLQGGTFVTPDTPDPAGTFLSLVDQGSKGSASERGFEAVQAALTEPLVSSTNAGFLREEAALSIIALTDENDDSDISSSAFTTWLQGLKADPSMVRFNAICGDRGFGCMEWLDVTTVLQATGGDDYIDVAYDTGGFWVSICTADYSAALEQVGLAAAGMVVSFVLSEEPSNAGMISVTVDGKTVVQDSSEGWTYNSAENAITFHGDAVPGPGSTVYVSYPVAGECPN